jgi:hypothetical protein
LAQAVLNQAVLDQAVLDNVRRYRAIACLCRRTAAFRPAQKLSLLAQAEDWERLALKELESSRAPVGIASEDPEPELEPDTAPQVETRWWLPRREGLFAGLAA